MEKKVKEEVNDVTRENRFCYITSLRTRIKLDVFRPLT